ncbi:hypothetical protein [Novosphingobium sp.]|uniref:hypothetical protein n=1 Tax=Novosphingobium sp. TaxID=1874826 RepID=UPI00286DD581|nr:hypothetical protein [Novosphingobium sp.]
MSFNACLAKLEADGSIDAERAARFRGEYERLNKAYGKRMGEVAAAQAAKTDVMDALERTAMTERRQGLLQIHSQRNLLQGLVGHVEAGGKAGHYAVSVMEHHEAVAGSAAIDNRRGALFKLAWSRMDGFLGKYRRDMLGRVRNEADLNDLVRALRGEKVESAATRELAGAVGDTMEWLRQLFNQAGGDIARLENWGHPQSHDALAVGQAGLEEWREFTRPLITGEKMIDTSTGKAFASAEALDEALEAAWQNIASEGMDGRIPGAFTGQGKVANRRSDHRFLVFKDADAWLAYNERFGLGNAFDAITGHIDSMVHDIAAMQVLGPNPAATVKWLGDVLGQQALPTRAGGKQVKLEASARKSADVLASMWDYYSGSLTSVPPEYRGTARFFSGVRNWNVATKLGSAAVSAVTTDPVFMGMTAKFNGLDATRVATDYFKLLADSGQRDVAAHAGLIFNDMISRGERMYREGQGVNVHEVTRRAADATLRGSGLTAHTVAGKQALGLGFMKDWADAAAIGFGDLPKADRLALERYGIGKADWDRLRALDAFDQGNGVKMLRPGDLARRGGAELDSAIKFMTLIDSEVRFGIPGESLRAQAMIASVTNQRSAWFRRGSVGGELVHSATQFKTYSVIMVTQQLMRAMYGRGGISRGAYAVLLPTFLTMGGFMANGFLDIVNGKDPSPADQASTWARAFVRGGGLGIVGDFIAQGFQTDRGTTVSGFVTGPTMGAIVDPISSLVLGNLGEAAEGKNTNIGREAAKLFNSAIPGSNLWYSRAAFNRWWADSLGELVDPNYRKSYRRLERNAAKAGTEYFWHPGDTWPERGPEL